MATFKILDHQISFDDDLAKYIEIYHTKNIWMNQYTDRYHSMNINIKTIDALIEYMNHLVDFMVNEFRTSADNVLNILANFQILDKSLNDITSHCQATIGFQRLIQSYNQDLNQLFRKIENYKRQGANAAANNIEGYYLNVISTSSWDILTADFLNDLEARRVEKKQAKAYNGAMKVQDIMYKRILDKNSSETQQALYKKAYPYGTQAIEEMFQHCIHILISEGKLKYDVKEHLQVEKASNILSNLGRIQDENVKKEQLIVALQANPISQEIHSKILGYVTNDFEEYVRFIQFIKCEDIVKAECLAKLSHLPDNADNKYSKILKLIDPNINVSAYRNSMNDSNQNGDSVLANDNNSALFDHDITSLAVNSSRVSKTEELSFNASYDRVFDELNYISYSMGKVERQSRENGYILLKCPKNFLQMLLQLCGFATIYIKITKVGEQETLVSITSYSNNTSPFTDPTVIWKNILIRKIKKRLQ